MNDYEHISKSIEYIVNNANSPPSLDEIANHVHLPPCYFQHLFKRWAGVSAKRFLHTLTVKHAKKLLDESKQTLVISNKLGFSNNKCRYNSPVSIEAMTTEEYKLHGHRLVIDYGIHRTPFGYALIALTERGICQLAFIDDGKKKAAIKDLEQNWPTAKLIKNGQKTKPIIKKLFEKKSLPEDSLTLYMKGTNFQFNVWRTLLAIPTGSLFTYGKIAHMIGKPNASRAVGNAIATNPIGFIIPCHRVIKSSGIIGDYRWGNTRKRAMIGRETCAN